MPHRLRAINYRVLATLLVVGIPVLLFGSFFVIERGRAELRDAFGLTLAQRAEQSAAAIDAYVYRRIVDVSLLARVPDVRTVAARQKRAMTPSEIADLDRRFVGTRSQGADGRRGAGQRGVALLHRHHPRRSRLSRAAAHRSRRPAGGGIEPDERLQPVRRGMVEARDVGRGSGRGDRGRRPLGRQRAHLRDGDCSAGAGRRRAPRRRAQGRGRHPRDAGVNGGHRSRRWRRHDGRAPQRVGRLQSRRRGPPRAVLRGARVARGTRGVGAGRWPVALRVQRASQATASPS